MTRPWPAPPVDTTVQLIGDVHLAGMTATRQTLLTRGTAKTHVPQVAATIQAGDATINGTPSEDAPYLAFMAGLSQLGELVQVVGNHDVQDDVRTPEAAAAALGAPARNYTVDLGFVTLVVVFPGDGYSGIWNSGSVFSTTTLAWLDTTLTAVTGLAWVVCHFPIYETVGGDPATQYTSTDTGFYVSTQTHGASSDDVLAVLAAHPNAVAWLNGHTHSSLSTDGFVTTKTVGGRALACINAGGAVSTDKASAVSQYTLGLLHTVYVTQADDDRIEVRYRAHHGGGFWDVRTGSEKTTTVIV